MIIVDTREQLPIWNPLSPGILRLKLEEGDYTTTDLYRVAHIERKSGSDLYGSLIQGHIRFRNEILRAKDKGIKLAIIVECPKETFIRKRFKGGYKLKTPSTVLRKIITTISNKYSISFIWCKDREDMKEQILLWFKYQNLKKTQISKD